MFLECYLSRKIQYIVDEANRINSEGDDEPVYIRKDNTEYFLGVDSSNNLSYVKSADAKAWRIISVNGKDTISDFSNPLLKLQLASDGESSILATVNNTSSLVYGEYNSNRFNMYVEGVPHILETRATGSGKKYLRPYDNLLGFKDTDKDNFEIVASNVADDEKLMPSIIPEGFAGKYFTIKHPMGYLTLKEETESLLLAPKDKSALQVWKFKLTEYGIALVSRDNEALAVAVNPESNSIKLINLSSENLPILSQLKYSALKVSPTSGANKYTIKSLYIDKFLTTTAVSYSPYWSGIDNSFGAWEFEETDHIVVNDWLRMYFEAQNRPNARDVEIPDYGYIDETKNNKEVKEYSILGYEDITFKHTDRTQWYAFENKVNLTDNSGVNAAKANYGYRVDTVNGKQYAVANNSGYDGYYWVAVGPKVIQKDFPLSGRSPGYADELYPMYSQGTLDAVLNDRHGKKLYIRCVIGDIKAHTWNNGVIQTDISYALKEGGVEYKDVNDHVQSTANAEWHRKNRHTQRDTLSCIEFISKTNNLGLDRFEIQKIIFYNNPIS